MTDRFYRYNLDGTIDAFGTCHTCGNPLDSNENCTYCEWVANPYPYRDRDFSQFCETCGAGPPHIDGLCAKCVHASDPDGPGREECLRRWLS